MKEPMTKSPTLRVETSSPTSTTVPTYSCPMRWFSTGCRPRKGHRSEPQMQAAASLMTASPGAATWGTGTSSTTMSPGARMMTAFMVSGMVGADCAVTVFSSDWGVF